jgi:hypothetical protein
MPIAHSPPIMHVFVEVVKLDDVIEVNDVGDAEAKVNV